MCELIDRFLKSLVSAARYKPVVVVKYLELIWSKIVRNANAFVEATIAESHNLISEFVFGSKSFSDVVRSPFHNKSFTLFFRHFCKLLFEQTLSNFWTYLYKRCAFQLVRQHQHFVKVGCSERSQYQHNECNNDD